MLRQQPLQQWIYDECKQLAEVAFQFQEMSAPSTFTSRAAAVLHDYQPEDVLYGQFMMKEFRPDLIGQVLDCLRVDWLTCFVQNSTVPDCDWLRPLLVADWAKEQWYGLDYRTYKLPLAVADTLTPALPIAACGELHLPERNHLIPSDLRIQGIRQSTPVSN
jgi:insulysin